MAHIDLSEALPGMQALLAYRPAIAPPLLQLMQTLMRGNCAFSIAERELLATAVSATNCCETCSDIHGAIAAKLSGRTPGWVQQQCADASCFAQPMQSCLHLGKAIAQLKYDVARQQIDALNGGGIDARSIHDLVLISALFTFFNKYIDGLGLQSHDTDATLTARAEQIAQSGYHIAKNNQYGLD